MICHFPQSAGMIVMSRRASVVFAQFLCFFLTAADRPAQASWISQVHNLAPMEWQE
jgi:hypothetical protein